MAVPRALGIGMLASGVVCPCHALVWLVGLAVGTPVLSPAVQDGVHATYVPLAVLAGAGLLRRSRRLVTDERQST